MCVILFLDNRHTRADISGSRNPALELLPRGNTKSDVFVEMAIFDVLIQTEPCEPGVAPGRRVVHGSQIWKPVVNVLMDSRSIKCGISCVGDNDSINQHMKRNSRSILMPFSKYSRARGQSG